MRRRIACIAMLTGMLAVSGCTSPGEQTLPDDLFHAARQSEKAPEYFNAGRPGTSCGEVTLNQGEQIPPDAVDCMDSAIGNLDTELAVVSPTTEGDPLVVFYRTAAGVPGVDKFTDGEFDRYGPKTWTHESCPETTTIKLLRGCLEF